MYEKLLERRSVRKYKPEQITEEQLDAVLKAGLYAPTAKNNQKPVMVAVRDKETRDLLSKINAEIMDVETDPFYGAPTVLVVLASVLIAASDLKKKSAKAPPENWEVPFFICPVLWCGGKLRQLLP